MCVCEGERTSVCVCQVRTHVCVCVWVGGWVPTIIIPTIYDPEDRPSAVEVLRRLEEAGRTVPQNCTETKLVLIHTNFRINSCGPSSANKRLQAEKQEKQQQMDFQVSRLEKQTTLQ